MNKSVLLAAALIASILSIGLIAAEAQQKTAQAPKAAEAPKAAPAKAGGKVTLTGCAAIGIMPTCVLMKGPDGASYEVTSARPVPPFDGTEVRLTGIVTDNLSICMQGRVLKDVEWTKTGRKCK